MRIYSMTATFGKLEQQTLTLQPGLNIIEAPNEWGKSTWSAFLVAMLYGISTREHTTKSVLADKTRYAPWSGSPMSGRIELSWNDRDITIERQTAGRSIFGSFRAYETQSGLPVTELTADNCGQQLLGVEKSVFMRSAFLRLADLPVTADEALRRRLNSLVTTGDESGAGELLQQKLKKLKNTCRSNAANGLIPQAKAEQAQLRQKLQLLESWSRQLQSLQQQDMDAALQLDRLYNHQAFLTYQQSKQQALQRSQTELQLSHTASRVRQLQAACAVFPATDQLQQQLSRRRSLQNQQQALQTQAQLLQPPVRPEPVTPALLTCTPEQARQDQSRYEQLRKGKSVSPALWIGGLVLLAAGGVSLLWQTFMGIGLLTVGAALLIAGLIRRYTTHIQNTALEREAQLLLELYRPLPPSQWVTAAQQHRDAFTGYALTLQTYESQRKQLQQQLSDLTAQLAALPEEQTLLEQLASHQALEASLREQQQLTQLLAALPPASNTPAPTQPDMLRCTPEETRQQIQRLEDERQQLRHDMGQCRGQMQALGERTGLEQKLRQVESRLRQLEATMAALELAQSTLAEATARLQRRFAPQISKRSLELFRTLTGGRYDRLTLDAQLQLQAGALGENTLQSILWRSDGTVDQLYLALRLAVAEALTPAAPLVLDDALVRFDDTRLEAALTLLQQQSKFRQVILFTCQSRENKLINKENVV